MDGKGLGDGISVHPLEEARMPLVDMTPNRIIARNAIDSRRRTHSPPARMDRYG